MTSKPRTKKEVGFSTIITSITTYIWHLRRGQTPRVAQSFFSHGNLPTLNGRLLFLPPFHPIIGKVYSYRSQPRRPKRAKGGKSGYPKSSPKSLQMKRPERQQDDVGRELLEAQHTLHKQCLQRKSGISYSPSQSLSPSTRQ
jgi:hypothetical protein